MKCNQFALVTWNFNYDVLIFQTKRSVDDREREKRETNLQKKVTDLTTQINRLEKRINVLRSENESLVSMEGTPSNRLFLVVAKRLQKAYCHDELFPQISRPCSISF